MADSSSEQPSLTVLGGPMAGQRLVLDESVANLLIGSDPSCDFYLPHDSVSPIHARLWVDLEGAVLHETSSPHGLYVNDDKVVGKRPLHHGDIVWLGPPGSADVVMIQCHLPETPAEAGEDSPAPETVAGGTLTATDDATLAATGPALVPDDATPAAADDPLAMLDEGLQVIERAPEGEAPLIDAPPPPFEDAR